ncbi:MAG: M23 family metallopeptidase, partial [Coleofasciculus sp. G1-WW12-02]|uniref:M23 family metallopeptidase n=1 Tax=Coleofasciculus sp. G1-WW12-02 TaxID=3068483 RepID=UPI003302369F
GRLYQSHVGKDNQIYTRSSTNGINWTAWKKPNIPNEETNHAVAMAAFNGRLYQSHVGKDKKIYTRSSTNGINWTAWKAANVPNEETYGTPWLDAFNGKLYQYHIGKDSYLYMRSSNDGENWNAWKKMGNARTHLPEVKRNTGGTNPNPNYIYTNADYLNALYQDNINNRLGSNSHNHDHIIREAVDSIDGDSNPGIYALVGGEVIEAKNGKEVSSKYWGYNGTVAIYNKELNQTFIYWHLAEGSINENLQGKTIAAGSLIGKEGNTGASYGSHTHVEVHNNRAYVNMSNPLNPQSPANSGRLHVPTVFQNAVRKGLVKLYK